MVVIQIIIISLVVLTLVHALFRSGKIRSSWALLKDARPIHFVMAAVALVGTVIVGVLLLQIPGLDFGWWKLLGGSGNVLFGATDESFTESTPGQESSFSSFLAHGVPLVLVTLLAVAVPFLARSEEEDYRKGSESRTAKQKFTKALQFGLVHLIMGIPIAFALALTVSGLVYTLAYMFGYRRSMERTGQKPVTLETLRADGVEVADPTDVTTLTRTIVANERKIATREGVKHATITHVIYNYTVIAVLLVTLISVL